MHACSVPLLLALLASPSTSDEGAATATVAPRWLPVDDPALSDVPEGLAKLPFEAREVYESIGAPRIVIARDLAPVDELFEAFATDEEALAPYGELIPVMDELLHLDGREVLVLRCEWTTGELAVGIVTLYDALEDGGVRSILVAEQDATDLAALQAVALEQHARLADGIAPPPAAAYDGVLLGHELEFALRFEGDGRAPIQLAPTDVVRAKDRKFFDGITDVNPQFEAGILRNFDDAERGVSVSYQVVMTDVALGLKEPFVDWLAGQFQVSMRGDAKFGDKALEIVHVPELLTRVVSDEEIARHYANNANAPEAGVILQVFVPRHPYARTFSMRWDDGEEDRPHGFAYVVELREYRRSRSETITRSGVVLLIVNAKDPADLTLVEANLGLASHPLDPSTRFPTKAVGLPDDAR